MNRFPPDWPIIKLPQNLGRTHTVSASHAPEANAKIDEAEALGRKLEDLHRDVSRMEQQRDALAALGDKHLDIAQKSYDQRYGIEVAWQPIRSVKSGNELAAELEVTIAPLRTEFARIESRIAELLA